MKTLLDLYQWFSELLKANPVVAGVFSLWGVAVISFVFIKAPSKIIGFIRDQFTTRIVFNNDESYDSYSNYSRFNSWFVLTKWSKFSRSLIFNSYYGSEGQEGVYGPGYGFHFFFYNYTFYWFYKKKIELAGSSSYKTREEIVLFCFGRNQTKLYKVIDMFKHKNDDTKLSVFVFEDGSWTRLTKISKKSMDLVVIKKSIKEKILKDILFFVGAKPWYDKSPVAHKITFMLHGKPGGGKSTFVKTVASYLGKDVYVLALSTVTDKGLVKALSSIPPNSILLVEDIHSCESVCIKIRDEKSISFADGLLTLSGILNAFGGIVPLEGIITFFTTNYLDKIEPALYRKGRCDYIYPFNEIGSEEINQYIRVIYNDSNYKDRFDYAPIMGCDLESIFLENKFDVKSFVDAIPKLTN